MTEVRFDAPSSGSRLHTTNRLSPELEAQVSLSTSGLREGSPAQQAAGILYTGWFNIKNLFEARFIFRKNGTGNFFVTTDSISYTTKDKTTEWAHRFYPSDELQNSLVAQLKSAIDPSLPGGLKVTPFYLDTTPVEYGPLGADVCPSLNITGVKAKSFADQSKRIKGSVDVTTPFGVIRDIKISATQMGDIVVWDALDPDLFQKAEGDKPARQQTALYMKDTLKVFVCRLAQGRMILSETNDAVTTESGAVVAAAETVAVGENYGV
jgi:hypothetical protein